MKPALHIARLNLSKAVLGSADRAGAGMRRGRKDGLVNLAVGAASFISFVQEIAVRAGGACERWNAEGKASSSLQPLNDSARRPAGGFYLLVSGRGKAEAAKESAGFSHGRDGKPPAEGVAESGTGLHGGKPVAKSKVLPADPVGGIKGHERLPARHPAANRAASGESSRPLHAGPSNAGRRGKGERPGAAGRESSPSRARHESVGAAGGNEEQAVKGKGSKASRRPALDTTVEAHGARRSAAVARARTVATVESATGKRLVGEEQRKLKTKKAAAGNEQRKTALAPEPRKPNTGVAEGPGVRESRKDSEAAEFPVAPAAGTKRGERPSASSEMAPSVLLSAAAKIETAAFQPRQAEGGQQAVPAWLSRFVDGASDWIVRVRSEGGAMVMKLDPPELGRVEVRVERTARGLEIRMFCSRLDTMVKIEQSIGLLQDRLQQLGVDSGGIDLFHQRDGGQEPAAQTPGENEGIDVPAVEHREIAGRRRPSGSVDLVA